MSKKIRRHRTLLVLAVAIPLMMTGCADRYDYRRYDLPGALIPARGMAVIPQNVSSPPYSVLPNDGQGSFV